MPNSRACRPGRCRPGVMGWNLSVSLLRHGYRVAVRDAIPSRTSGLARNTLAHRALHARGYLSRPRSKPPGTRESSY